MFDEKEPNKNKNWYRVEDPGKEIGPSHMMFKLFFDCLYIFSFKDQLEITRIARKVKRNKSLIDYAERNNEMLLLP